MDLKTFFDFMLVIRASLNKLIRDSTQTKKSAQRSYSNQLLLYCI
jgi:hypothetical protein